MNGWPAWLDQAETTADRVQTCPDCFWLDDAGVTRFARYKGEGCKHKERPTGE